MEHTENKTIIHDTEKTASWEQQTAMKVSGISILVNLLLSVFKLIAGIVNGGKGLAMADWSDINGTITLNVTFNDTVDQVETDDASVQASCSGQTATLTFASTATNPLTIGIHLNHGTSIDNLQMTGFTYSVN